MHKAAEEGLGQRARRDRIENADRASAVFGMAAMEAEVTLAQVRLLCPALTRDATVLFCSMSAMSMTPLSRRCLKPWSRRRNTYPLHHDKADERNPERGLAVAEDQPGDSQTSAFLAGAADVAEREVTIDDGHDGEAEDAQHKGSNGQPGGRAWRAVVGLLVEHRAHYIPTTRAPLATIGTGRGPNSGRRLSRRAGTA